MWQINGVTYDLPAVSDIVALDVVTQLGYDIPRFCYHEGLKVAGNCRMCLVEDIKAAKPVVSCAMTITPELEIFLNTTRVKKAREAVMEFLLINHPLDCPICDQGGECDLQDLSMIYGSDHGRFYGYKRNVEDKNCGLVVKTAMNRCILCTRCVRFATDVAGFAALGMTGRGNKTEIGSYVERIIDTELSGNLIDVCPVGALTSKPYSFASRPWELKRLFTLNVLDDEIQKIRVDTKENALLRITPSKDDNIMNYWITNRVRFSYEGLIRSRKTLPLLLGLTTTWAATCVTIYKVLSKLIGLHLSFLPLVYCSDNTLSNRDIYSLKNFTNSTAALYYCAAHSSTSVCLNTSYPTLLKKDFTTFTILNLDLEFYAPLFWLTLQQRQNYSLYWYSRVASQANSVLLLGSLSALIKFLRSKTWHSLVFRENVIISSLLFSSKLSNFNPIVLSHSASQRAKIAFNLTARTNSQNINLTQTPLKYGLCGPTTPSIAATLSIIQATHAPSLELFKNLLFLPSSSIYEQPASEYYDTSYKLHSTNRVVATLAKTPTTLIKVLFGLLGGTAPCSHINDNPERYNCDAVVRIPVRAHLPLDHLVLNTFLRINKKAYYNSHFLTKMSTTPKTIEWKNIYLKQ